MYSMTNEEIKSENSTMAASDSATCGKCGLTQDKVENDTLIKCDGSCQAWYHTSCVDSDEMMSYAIDVFHCPDCAAVEGPSTFYQMLVPHRHRYYELSENSRTIQVGSKQWIEDFFHKQDKIPPPRPEEIDFDKYQVHILTSGYDLFRHFYGDREWKHIFLIQDKKGLDMKTPASSFTIEDALDIMGPHTYVDTIDVYRQVSKSMRLDRFVEAWKDPERPRLYNILSMEFSKAELRHYFAPPRFVSELSWASLYWPKISANAFGEREDLPLELEGSNPMEVEVDTINDLVQPKIEQQSEDSDNNYKVDEEDYAKKPEVELFCLIGMKGSYTDFHIDFGGSSVYYHIFGGKKIFYVAPPLDEVLKLYSDYMKDNKNHEIWLGDALMERGLLQRIEVEEGNTLLIPSGWLHAVLTPMDSIVFGGNFLHRCNISMQLSVNQIEEDTNIDEKYMFPHFRLCNWYAAKSVATEIREYNHDDEICPQYLYEGAMQLYEKLQTWSTQDESLEKFAPPIMKMLRKELERQKKIRQREENSPRKSKTAKRKSRDDDDTSDQSQDTEEDKKELKKLKIKNVQPSSLKVIIRRDSIPMPKPEVSSLELAAPLEIVEQVPEKDLVATMFSAPTSSGRMLKPTKFVRELCGDDVDHIPVSYDPSTNAELANQPELDLDLIAKQEEKEFEFEQKKKKNSNKTIKQKLQGVNKAISGTDKKNKPPAKPIKSTTIRERLAKKLKMGKTK